MNISLGEKIVQIRKELGFNMSEAADKLEIVKSNLSRYERNLISPSAEFFKRLLYVFHVNINWLLGGVGEMFLSEEEIEKLHIEEVLSMKEAQNLISSFKRIDMPKYFLTTIGVPVYTEDVVETIQELLPVVGEISAGEPIEIINNEPLDFVPFPYYRPNLNLDDFFVFRVNGMSMNPDIEHQDIVFIHKNTDWDSLNKKIVAIIISGELTIKKLDIRPDLQELHLIPINKNFGVIKVPIEEMRQISLLGELKAIRRVRK
ncbi:MAG: S24 family peptidase [Candidatus Cloacimonetes bacterium]|nr:S24 family peptidase [Candidatus Cloacimonadota bacterium]